MKNLFRLGALCALLALSVCPAFASITYVTSDKSAGGGDGITVATAGVDSTGANFEAVGVIWQGNSNTGTVVDSKSNTLTALTRRSNGGINKVQWYYACNPTVGSGHTATYSNALGVGGDGAQVYPRVFTIFFSGVKSSLCNDSESAGGSTGGATHLQAGSITPSEDNEVVLNLTGSFGSSGQPGTQSATGYTTAQQANVESNAFAGSISYQIQTTATATNPDVSWTDSVAAVGSNADFKVSPSTSAYRPRRRRQ